MSLHDEDGFTWDYYDLHYVYKEDSFYNWDNNTLFPIFKQNASTQTHTKIATCLCDKCHHPYNNGTLKKKNTLKILPHKLHQMMK